MPTALKNEFKLMIIKDIALWPLENTELSCQEVNMIKFYGNIQDSK